jgi:pimeloyl-ACP methyl ester carboxylesterase
MRPFHFGSSQKTLFGMHHPPPTAARAVGVVLCNPLGQEAIRGHRAYRQLTSLFNKARFHVLRFDYFSTGDSAGESFEADPAQWIEDVGTAADELKDITGVTKLAFVGLRLGATLALLASQDRKDLDSVVLWDPVVFGAAYLEELRATHLEYMAQELGDGFNPARASVASEALGFPLTDALVLGLKATDLTSIAGCSARSTALIVSQPTDAYQALRARLASLGVEVAYQEVVAERWNSDEAMNAALVPSGLLQAIVARVAPRA